MEPFKITHFERKHGFPFPRVRSLSNTQCFAIRQILERRLALRELGDTLGLVRALDEVQEVVAGLSANDISFDILRVLPVDAQKIGTLFINWYRFDSIDEVDGNELAAFFDDFWYPSSDDIDIFDATLSWVVSVRHDGIVKLARLNADPIVGAATEESAQ